VLTQAEDSALARAERALLERAARVDEASLDAVDYLPAFSGDSRTLVVRAAGFDPSLWWLDRVAVLELRQRVGQLRWPEPIGVRPPIRFSKRKLERSLRPIPEVVGCEDDLAQVGESWGFWLPGYSRVRLEVLAVGLREGDDLEPGCVYAAPAGETRASKPSRVGRSPHRAVLRVGGCHCLPSPAPSSSSCACATPQGLREERIQIELDD